MKQNCADPEVGSAQLSCKKGKEKDGLSLIVNYWRWGL